jgi:hypothetical protein
MRIPNEALPLYRRESKTPAEAEERNSKPVSGPARIRSALSNLLPGQRRADKKDDDLAEESLAQNLKRRLIRGQPDNPERRREERRKSNQPILLDTRATRSRRESARHPTINFKI